MAKRRGRVWLHHNVKEPYASRRRDRAVIRLNHFVMEPYKSRGMTGRVVVTLGGARDSARGFLGLGGRGAGAGRGGDGGRGAQRRGNGAWGRVGRPVAAKSRRPGTMDRGGNPGAWVALWRRYGGSPPGCTNPAPHP